MSRTDEYTDNPPSRDEIDARSGKLVLEFGTAWCGHCQVAQPHISKVLAAHPELEHLKIEDGPGRRLGRSYRVKLWPTLIFLNHGGEIQRVVRPTDEKVVHDALQQLISAS